jgi:hypothetical protein
MRACGLCILTCVRVVCVCVCMRACRLCIRTCVLVWVGEWVGGMAETGRARGLAFWQHFGRWSRYLVTMEKRRAPTADDRVYVPTLERAGGVPSFVSFRDAYFQPTPGGKRTKRDRRAAT